MGGGDTHNNHNLCHINFSLIFHIPHRSSAAARCTDGPVVQVMGRRGFRGTKAVNDWA